MTPHQIKEALHRRDNGEPMRTSLGASDLQTNPENLGFVGPEYRESALSAMICL
jgi:hypothetical protein